MSASGLPGSKTTHACPFGVVPSSAAPPSVLSVGGASEWDRPSLPSGTDGVETHVGYIYARVIGTRRVGPAIRHVKRPAPPVTARWARRSRLATGTYGSSVGSARRREARPGGLRQHP